MHPTTEAATASTSGRTGATSIERQALARVRIDVASMPASDVVQLALWPDSIANWTRSVRVSSSVAYNMLGRVKPYRRVRELLAHRLGVPTFVLDHLIDAARPLASALRPPDPTREAMADAPGAPPAARAPRTSEGDDDPEAMRLLLPTQRDGSNPLERIAAHRVEIEIAALPASLVVQLALYPETLAAWARRAGVPAPLLYSTLAAGQPNQRIRHALASRLGVAPRELDALVNATRAEPRATLPPMIDAVPRVHAPPVQSPPPPPTRGTDGDGPASASAGQLPLGV